MTTIADRDMLQAGQDLADFLTGWNERYGPYPRISMALDLYRERMTKRPTVCKGCGLPFHRPRVKPYVAGIIRTGDPGATGLFMECPHCLQVRCYDKSDPPAELVAAGGSDERTKP